ncbi:hypothetical protein [Anaerocolumna chitinilytica]|uniref:Uncharacterized protein n=1 Tax=Anaerocolumna chitinilytica TaxID=1727145 RepID=A0A7I8DM74_9FIRM|nr:hypothetical protein [Anaerocolumna chitinilytica]BCJ98381.1 hypothetical protein bsdcttw_14220 [Anaerocolumna chitinilytica]
MAETGTKVKQNQKGREDAKVEVANSISILDYANKNEMNILYEDSSIARIEAAGGNLLTVFKDNNSWSSSNGEEEIKTYGNTIRFVAKMENIEWREAIDKLVEERGDYLSSSEYNAAYEKMYAINNQEPLVANVQSTESRNLNNVEKHKVRNISISDYARALGLPVEEINRGKISIIKDPRFEGLLIYNSSNKWDWNSKFVHDGDSIKFAERIQNISREKAIESLTAYADTGEISGNSTEKEIVEAPDEPVELSESKSEDLNDKPIITENEPETSQNLQHSRIRKTMTKEQLSELLSGYRRNIDVSAFDNPNLSPSQMRQLRIAKQNGINPEDFNDPSLTADYMKEIRLAAENGVDLSVFKNDENKFIYSAEQAKEIRLGKQNGLMPEEVATFAKEGLDSEVMKEMRLGLQDGMVQMRNLGNGSYSAKDIHSIRMTIMVNHIVEAIKIQLRNFFDSLISIFKDKVIHDQSLGRNNQVPGSEINGPSELAPNTNVEKVAINEVKNAIESIYEAIADEIQNLPLEEKKDAIISALRTVSNQVNENDITKKSDIEKSQALEEAINSLVDEKQEEALKQAALERLEEDYVEQFYQNEIDYNDNIMEFTNSIVNNSTMPSEVKKSILDRTIERVFGDGTTEKLISRLSPDDFIPELPKQSVEEMLLNDQERSLLTNMHEKLQPFLDLDPTKEADKVNFINNSETGIKKVYKNTSDVVSDISEFLKSQDHSKTLFADVPNEASGFIRFEETGMQMSLENYKEFRNKVVELYNNSDMTYEEKAGIIISTVSPTFGKELSAAIISSMQTEEIYQEKIVQELMVEQ